MWDLIIAIVCYFSIICLGLICVLVEDLNLDFDFFNDDFFIIINLSLVIDEKFCCIVGDVVELLEEKVVSLVENLIN